MRKLLLIILIVGLLLCGLLICRHDQEKISEKIHSETTPIDAMQQGIRLDLRTDYTNPEPDQDTESESSTQIREEYP